MTKRERVLNAIEWKPADVPAAMIYFTEVGLYEHGEKIRDLMKSVDADFGPVPDFPVPKIPLHAVDENGKYYELYTDEWGVKWEYRIFKMMGHALEKPLEDIKKVHNYTLPSCPVPAAGTNEFKQRKNYFSEFRKTYWHNESGGGIFERMLALCNFEELLENLYDDTEEINLLADKICAYNEELIAHNLALNPDSIQFGDDFGMQSTMMISPDMFRSFFKPRYEKLIKPIKEAGKKVFFHSCGHNLPVLKDFKEIGVDAIWPQLTAYDLTTLADACKALKLAIYIHPDRAGLMTSGTPEQVEQKLYEYNDIFKPRGGGSFFYLEVDNGFPYENIVALAETVKKMRFQ